MQKIWGGKVSDFRSMPHSISSNREPSFISWALRFPTKRDEVERILLHAVGPCHAGFLKRLSTIGGPFWMGDCFSLSTVLWSPPATDCVVSALSSWNKPRTRRVLVHDAEAHADSFELAPDLLASTFVANIDDLQAGDCRRHRTCRVERNAACACTPRPLSVGSCNLGSELLAGHSISAWRRCATGP